MVQYVNNKFAYNINVAYVFEKTREKYFVDNHIQKCYTIFNLSVTCIQT